MREQDNIYNKKGGALLSKRPSYKRMSSASMTVEACFVLPFFLFAFLNIISIIDIYRLQGSMSSAMHMTAKQMAVYAYEYKEVKGGDEGYAASLGLTYAYAANKVKSSLGEDYPSSVSWIRSSVLKDDECIDLIAQYTVKPPISLMGYGSSLMYNRIRTRAWTGYDNAKKGEGAGDEEIVYITETGTVYHRTRTCTYLKLSIRAVDKSSLDALRSEDGGKYYACEECGKSDTSTVYITNYGNRYHTKLSCSKLKRTIMAVPISEVGDKGACSKCG